jgi:hypothetical protein
MNGEGEGRPSGKLPVFSQLCRRPARLAAAAAAAAASPCLLGCYMLFVLRPVCNLVLVRPHQDWNGRGVVLGRPPDVTMSATTVAR